MSRNAVSFWIRSMISHVYGSATDSDCEVVKVKAQVVQKLGTSLLFKSAIQQVLKAGTGYSHTTSTAIYMRDVTYRCIDTFFVRPLVAAQQAL